MPDTRSLPRLRRFCRLGDVVLKISMAIVCLLLVAVVFGAVMTFLDPDFFGSENDLMLIYMVSALFRLISGLIGCYLGHRILSSVAKEDSTPFTMENVRMMKRISALAVVTIALVLAVDLTLYICFKPVEYIPEFPLVTLLMAFLTYAFSLLFEYGTALQTESDDFL